ncbi:glycoside hydrolase family 125 protein [Thermaerobacter composti]|uniref:Glycoside hydrolase family 125 protein n=1 Tax=Thermaerobacter composti TaxID=554949 RepID=A0ABZ0QN22_9FIRM|nr:glycoside hydrolase family 125 protein [Thermaerobacter composti]WPD18897.1 glycoside hydrolase family 125 protein [Thermaerobacter composti]
MERDIAEASVPTRGSPGPQGPHGRVAPARRHAPILTVPDELADVEPVALTGNFWVSLPDLDPATGAARSVGIVSETARGLIEFTGAPEPQPTTDRATDGEGPHARPRGDRPSGPPVGEPDGPTGPLLVPVVTWEGRRIWPPEPALSPETPTRPPAEAEVPGVRPPRRAPHYMAGWIPRWFIPLPVMPGLLLELTWLAPVDHRGFAVRARLILHPASPPGASQASRGAQRGPEAPPAPPGAGDRPPAPALIGLRPAAAEPVPPALRLGLLVRPGAVFRTVYHRRPLPGSQGPRPHRWTRTLVWEAPGAAPLGALALRSGPGDEPAAGGAAGTWVFWARPGDGELVVYGGVAPEGDGAAATAVHLARVGWDVLFGQTVGWLAARDPFRSQAVPEAGSGPHAPLAHWPGAPPATPSPRHRPPGAPLPSLARPAAVPPTTPYAPAVPGATPAADAPPAGDATERAARRRSGLARAVAAGLLDEGEADELAERVRRNLWFAVFFAHARTVDREGWVHLTSRSPRYYVSGAHWTRDSLLWAFPAVLAADRRLARQLLVAAFDRYTLYPGEHSQYLDGTVLYPGWELDQAAAWPLSLARYVRATGDVSVLDEPAVARGVAAALQAAEARRDPATGLVATFLMPSDDPAPRPFVTYANALYAQALAELARVLSTSTAQRPAAAEATPHPAPAAVRCDPSWAAWLEARARLTRHAVLRHCVVPGPWGPQFAWAVAGPEGADAVLYDEPPGTLELLGPYGFARRQPDDPVDVEAVYANTVRWIYSQHNPFGPPPGPFATPTCPHARHPWLLSVAAGLLAGRPEYLAWLARAPMDGGWACETVDAATGEVRTGPAFATCAGFVSWAALVALESLGREPDRGEGSPHGRGQDTGTPGP